MSATTKVRSVLSLRVSPLVILFVLGTPFLPHRQPPDEEAGKSSQDAETTTRLGVVPQGWGKFHRDAKNTGCLLETILEHPKPWITETTSPLLSSSNVIGPDGTIYVGGDCAYAFDGLTGEIKWKYRTTLGINSSLALAPNGLIYGSGGGIAYALNSKTGKLKWSVQLVGVDSQIPVVGADGTVYITGTESQPGDKRTGILYALNGEKGAEKWKVDLPDAFIQTPAISRNGVVYVACRRLYAIDSVKGKIVWSYPFSTANDLVSGGVAIGNDGTIYAGGRLDDDKTKNQGVFTPSQMFAITPEGKLKWKTKVRGGIVGDSPALSDDGKLYFGCFDGRLYALSILDGKEIWTYNTGDKIYTTPCVGQDGTVYIGSNNGKLYAVDGKNGDKLGEFYIAPILQSSPAIMPDSTIYINSRDGRVFCIPREMIR